MTRDDIIRMARKAGGTIMQPFDYGASPNQMILTFNELKRFASQVAKVEREECAKVCDEAVNSISETADAEVREVATNVCVNLGRAIRARGTT